MSVQVTPHPAWVADLDAALDPSREAILDTPVIVHASENELVDGKIQNFLVAFYPIIRDPPPRLGGRPGCLAGSLPRGDPGHAGDRPRLGERAGGRQDPELPGGLLPDHP